MPDFVADFTLEQQPTIEANLVLGEQNVIDAELKLDVQGITKHNLLFNRDLPDQHPMSAITGLQEALIAVSDKTFVFEQGIANDTWNIVHNMGKHPSVFAVDSAGSVQIPNEIIYVSDNEVTVTFLAPFAGKAYLN